jgi:hypothetical protein
VERVTNVRLGVEGDAENGASFVTLGLTGEEVEQPTDTNVSTAILRIECFQDIRHLVDSVCLGCRPGKAIFN